MVNSVVRVTERLLKQWADYDETYDQLSQWIKDTEAKVKADMESKATLDEKRESLKKHKVGYFI